MPLRKFRQRAVFCQAHARVIRGESFAFETTLAGVTYGRAIPLWQAAGYHVKLIFLTLPSLEMAIMRVAARVAQGGHDVPEHVIRRRFDAGLRNFHQRYKSLADGWILYDNSRDEPVILDAGGRP